MEWGETLDSLVRRTRDEQVRVHDVDIVHCVHSDSFRVDQLAITRASAAKSCEKSSVPSKLLDSTVVSVCHEQVARSVQSYPLWRVELSICWADGPPCQDEDAGASEFLDTIVAR